MSDFKLPDIGEGIVECEVVEWRVAEGDHIEEDQPIVEVMTDKALVEITAPEAGVVTRLYVPQGQIAKVHAPLYAYQGLDENEGEGGRSVSHHASSISKLPDDAVELPVATPPSNPTAQGAYGKVPASPAVRRLVREHGLTITEVAGSGKEGRVLKEDVLAHIHHNEVEPSIAKPAPTINEAHNPEQDTPRI